MSRTLPEIYRSTLTKYNKYKDRYLKNLHNGRFYQLSSKKQHQVTNRLKRLRDRIAQLKLQLKIALATGALIISGVVSEVKGQQLGPFAQNDVKNPFYRPNFNDTNVKVSFGDIDADGDFDMAMGVQSGNIRFFENVGNPNSPKFFEQFSINNPFSGVLVNNDATPHFVDLDGDGDLDILVGDNSFTYPPGGNVDIRYYRNSDVEDDGILGNGPNFIPISEPGSPIDNVDATKYHSNPTTTDLDNDGDIDIFVGQNPEFFSYTSLFYFENDGGFSPASQPTGLDFFGIYYIYRVAPNFMDVDGDGDLDLLAGRDNGSILFFRNTDLDPSDPADVTIGDDIAFTELSGTDNPFDAVNVGFNSTPVTVDLDGDGLEDVVIGSQSQGIAYFHNDGAGNFTEVTGFDSPFERIDFGDDTSPTTFDIDNNGDLDIVIGAKYNPQTLYSFINNGDATLTEISGTANPFDNILSGGDTPIPEFADIDGDGDQDLFVGFYDFTGVNYGRILFFENLDIDPVGDPGDVTVGDDPTFTPSASPIPNTLNGVYYAQTLGDFDGDGDIDAVIGTDGLVNFHFFLNNGTPTAHDLQQQNPADPPFNGVKFDAGYYYMGPKPYFVDLDHDGDLDIISGGVYGSNVGNDGKIYLFQNDGTSLIPQLSFASPFYGIDLGTHSDPVTIDFDNDGDLDIFSGNNAGRIDFIENTNIPARIVATVNDPITFTEGDSPIQLNNTLIIADQTDDFISTAVVTIENYVGGEDLLDFDPSFGITGSFETSGPNAGSLLLTIPHTTTYSELQMVLRGVTYENIGTSVATGSRSIRFEVIDFDNTNPGPSDTEVITVNVIGVPNAAPIVTASAGDITFTEGDPVTVIDNGLSISDSNDTNLASASINITSNFVEGEDLLDFVDQNGITGSFDAASGSLTLTGVSSVANYQTALRSVTYANLSNNPSSLTRTVSFTVNDGEDDSNVANRNIMVIPVNDAPTIVSENGQINLDYTQNNAALAIDDLIDVFDSDDTDLEGASVVINDFQVGDLLSFTDQNGITGNVNDGVLTLTGTASIANYRTALRSVLFETSNGTGTRSISFTADDGSDVSPAYTRSINIAPSASQPPIVDTTPATTQVGSRVTIDLCAIISDPDNTFDELTITVVSILSNASTEINGCDLEIDYAGLSFSGQDVIVLRAVDPDGNIDENSLTVDVEAPGGKLVIYNAISPNGDGNNDWWEIVNLTTPNTIELYNRWGDSVKTLNNYENVENNNLLDDLPAGTYFYFIKSPEGEFEGYIVIKK